MIELGIEHYKPLLKNSIQANFGSKPCFIFIGDGFEQKESFSKLSNILLDMFRGETLDHVNLAGLDHVIVCTAIEDVIHFDHYAISLKKSGSKLPRVELTDIGPSFEITLRRETFASGDLMKEALSMPRALKPRKEKNIEKTHFGKGGRVHMVRQDLTKLATKKMKGLKKKHKGAQPTKQ